MGNGNHRSAADQGARCSNSSRGRRDPGRNGSATEQTSVINPIQAASSATRGGAGVGFFSSRTSSTGLRGSSFTETLASSPPAGSDESAPSPPWDSPRHPPSPYTPSPPPPSSPRRPSRSPPSRPSPRGTPYPPPAARSSPTTGARTSTRPA